MFNSELLDIAIGLFFIYLLLSLLCTAIAEMVEARMRFRALGLENGLRDLFAESREDAHKKELMKSASPTLIHGSCVGEFYRTSLIRSVSKATYNPPNLVAGSDYGHAFLNWLGLVPGFGFFSHWKRLQAMPSYIPQDTFALALMDMCGVSTAAALTNNQIISAGMKGPPSIGALLANIKGSNVYSPELMNVLGVLLEASGDDPKEFSKNIQAWYTTGMERVSGWYKRRTQALLFFIGLAVTVTMNVNTIDLCQELATNKPIRDALVAGAIKYSADITAHPTPAAPQGPFAAPPLPPDPDRAKIAIEEIKKYKLKFGWSDFHAQEHECLARYLVTSLAGWLLTAAAISLGAPFWFDLLNKFVNIRSTAKPECK